MVYVLYICVHVCECAYVCACVSVFLCVDVPTCVCVMVQFQAISPGTSEKGKSSQVQSSREAFLEEEGHDPRLPRGVQRAGDVSRGEVPGVEPAWCAVQRQGAGWPGCRGHCRGTKMRRRIREVGCVPRA